MESRRGTLLCLCLLFTVLFLGLGCGETIDPNEPQGFIQTKGSDTIVNAMQEVAEEFMMRYPHVFVAITGGGSGVGIASLINKTTDIATASREMKPKEIEIAQKRGVFPKEFVVAYDGVAVIVNHANPIDRLSLQDLHDLFVGKITNWKQLGGPDVPVVTLSREVSSGTHMYFKEEVIHLGKKDSIEEFSKETLLLTSSQAIVEEVTNNPGGIGYLGMGYLSDRTKPVLVGKVKNSGAADDRRGPAAGFYPPTVENVVNKTYPLSRPLFVYTDGEPQGVVKLFIDFTLGPAGQKQFMQTGFVPVGETIAREP